MTQRKRMLGIGAAVAAAAAAGLWAWAGREVTVDGGTRVVMGTFARLVVVAPSRSTATRGIEAAFRDLQWVEQLMSYHRPDSELARVNAEAYDHPVQVSEPMMVVLRKALEVSQLSEGSFDVTVGPLMDLWKAAGQAGVQPTDAELSQARARVGWDKVSLDPNQRTVRFKVQGMKIDLGGIAKGYAVDRSVEILKEQGALGGMVDLGGNIRCFGRPPQGKDFWRIGVQDPCHVDDEGPAEERISMVLRLTDQAVATSGHYRRFVMVGDRKVSHILDPRTGMSNEQVSSVTIIAPDAMTADAMTKPVCLLGEEEAISLVEGLPQVEAIVMKPDRTGGPDQPGMGSSRLRIIKTRGAERFIEKP